MRYAITGAIAAGITALFLTLVANPHALPVPVHKPWNKWTLKQQERYVRSNVAHAKGVLDWFRTHKTKGVGALVVSHRRLLVKARANLKAIEVRLHPPFRYPWWWVPLGVCETGVSPPDPAYGKAGHPGGDGYEGWINFLNSTWLTYGGGRYAAHAYDATEYQQYLVTLRMHADVPWSQSNPACSARLGL